ncbi:DUF6934 family protein [Pedobacter hartonius]
MSLKININFKDTYTPIYIEEDLSGMSFNSPQKNGSSCELLAMINPYPGSELPGVYNIGFGPPDGKGRFIDYVDLKHTDSNKVFLTVLLFGITFLQRNPELTHGLDGSTDTRAALYHLMYKYNKTYLTEFFDAIGVDWYIRVFRNNTYDADSHGNFIARPRPEPFNYKRDRHDLYRYYMFRLK